jgi:hypothetical protein
MNQPTPPGPPRPTDAELERLGIVWVDERGVTPVGLPYPASSDPVANGAANIQALAAALDPGPRGLIGRTTMTGSLDATTGSNLMTTTVTLPTQRWLRVWAVIGGQQITGASTNLNLTIYGNGAAGLRFGVGTVAAGETIVRLGWHEFRPSAGNFTAYVLASTAGGGALRVSNVSVLTIEDLGYQI